MDKQQKKKRKRGPYLKNTSEAEDESELTLSVDSSYANLQEETDEVLKEQTTSSSSPNRLRVTVSINWTRFFFNLYYNNKQLNYNFGLTDASECIHNLVHSKRSGSKYAKYPTNRIQVKTVLLFFFPNGIRVL